MCQYECPCDSDLLNHSQVEGTPLIDDVDD